ncbi:MAG: hypothetical protein ACO1SX_23365 [Actinomycetota bacterium]
MPATSSTDRPDASARLQRIARAWKLIRGGALALFSLQVAGGLDTILTATPADRLGYGLFSVGWLMLAAILTYGVWMRMNWSLRVSGVLAALSMPVYLASPFFPRVDIGGAAYYASPLSAPLDLLSGIGCGVLLVGLWQLKRARQGLEPD